MKKIFIFSITLLFISFIKGQHTTPRFGILPKDNTGRVITYGYVSTTKYKSNDTVLFSTSSYETYLVPNHTITDSICFKPTITSCYLGDKLNIVVTNSSGAGHKLKFSGSNWQMGGTVSYLTLTSGARCIAKFEFDGGKWVFISATNMTGATGIAGAVGATGATGATGAM